MGTLTHLAPKDETLSQRVRRLQAEARELAGEHVTGFLALLIDVENLAIEIAEGGEAYPPGIRDLAQRLGERISTDRGTMLSISGRT